MRLFNFGMNFLVEDGRIKIELWHILDLLENFLVAKFIAHNLFIIFFGYNFFQLGFCIFSGFFGRLLKHSVVTDFLLKVPVFPLDLSFLTIFLRFLNDGHLVKIDGVFRDIMNSFIFEKIENFNINLCSTWEWFPNLKDHWLRMAVKVPGLNFIVDHLVFYRLFLDL